MTLKAELVLRCDSLGCESTFTTGADMSGMGRFLDAAFASGWTDPEACQYCPSCSAVDESGLSDEDFRAMVKRVNAIGPKEVKL